MEKSKETKAITLIALVITIIILLILAGITIQQLSNSGLFDKLKLSKAKWENSQVLENSILGDYENEIDLNLKVTPRGTIELTEEALQNLINTKVQEAVNQKVESTLSNYATKDDLTEISNNSNSLTITKLWSQSTAKTSGSITLSDNATNYKFIVVNSGYTGTSLKNWSTTIMKDDLVTDNSSNDRYEIDGYDTRYVNFYFSNYQTITINGSNALGILSVYGVN